MKILLSSILSLMLLASCAPSPRDIAYGSDTCHYCKMTIVDAQHAAQLVTPKGKIYMFDAIECMVHYTGDTREAEYAFELVNDYTTPGVLLNANESTYLISKAIPSPMGAFLSAFPSAELASQMQKQKGGQAYDWSGLRQHMLGTASAPIADIISQD